MKKNNNIKIRPGEYIAPLQATEMKYKLLTIADKDLVICLERESKDGYEPVEFLEKVNPSASSDFVGWRVLLRKK